MEKVSLTNLVSHQLPEFVRNEYPVFVTFLEKYYAWLETTGKVTHRGNALREAHDIDLSDSYYIQYLQKDLLPYFPEELTSNKRLFLKLVSEFYRANGTPDSIKFLFRVLYGEDITIYFPKDDILKASDGKWILPLALRIDTDDQNIFNIEKTVLIGQTSGASSVVEKVIKSVDRQLGISYIEVYISNIERLYTTGETVTATYLTTSGSVTVSGRLIGSLSQINVDPQNRGLFYAGYDATLGYSGDPVTIVGGLNELSPNPIGAVANVGETTKGGIVDIYVTDGGYGFRNQSTDPGTAILDFIGGFTNAPIGTEAKASLSLIDDTQPRNINVSVTGITTLNAAYSNIGELDNAVSSIAEVNEWQEFTVYPISFISLDGSGGGYREKPTLDVFSFYNETYADTLVASTVNLIKDNNTITNESVDFGSYLQKGNQIRLYKANPNFEEILEVVDVSTHTITVNRTFPNTVQLVSLYKINRNDLKKLGSIGRISVSNGGSNYANGEIIIFTGGSGYGANAYVSDVHSANGGIKTVTINNHSSNAYVIGGEGYRANSLPTLSVQTASGNGAILTVPEICGDGEEFSLSTSRIGAISTIRVSSYGYDYVQAPKISLRNMDLTVANATVGQLFVSNTSVYQGTSNSNFSFKATVDRYDADSGFLRVFDYIGTIQKGTIIKYDSEDTLEAVTANVTTFKIYGDGRAKATAVFENGLIRYPGIYLNTDGHVSSDKKLQDANKYHNFSYVIKTTTPYSSFKKPLGDISHPMGSKVFVTKIDDNSINVSISNTATVISLIDYVDTFNIFSSDSNVFSTNVSSALSDTINVGDVIILQNASRKLTGNVITTSGSNLVYGNTGTVNFINDLQDGDIINIQTGGSGNTVNVVSVVNATHMIVNSTIGITSYGVNMNLIYDEIHSIGFVNADVIQTNTVIRTTDTEVSAIIKKVR